MLRKAIIQIKALLGIPLTENELAVKEEQAIHDVSIIRCPKSGKGSIDQCIDYGMLALGASCAHCGRRKPDERKYGP